MSREPAPRPAFDAYASDYDRALQEGISVSGEDKEYFAQGRVAWLARRLEVANLKPQRILDFGCGTGSGAQFLSRQYPQADVLGVDISAASLETGRRLHGSPRVTFRQSGEYEPRGEMDLAYCNGVFHHIPLVERAGAVDFVWRALRPGGVFAFWENNPWNPGTRYIMSRIPFDRDAITLTPPEAARLLTAGKFQRIGTDFLFIFPHALHWFRWMEPAFAKLPLGAQYLVLCRKP
jgi:SAM-dependent methyltransferase